MEEGIVAIITKCWKKITITNKKEMDLIVSWFFEFEKHDDAFFWQKIVKYLSSETLVPKHKVHKVNCCIFNRFVNNSNFLRKLFLMRFAQVYQERQNPISSFFLVPFIRKTINGKNN